MPSYYMYQCNDCGWRGERYRNIKTCSTCGAPITRIPKFQCCYHGTDLLAAKQIEKEGFKAGTWFAVHMEDAVKHGMGHIFEVELESNKIPKGWQFHKDTPTSTDQIRAHYVVIGVKSCQ